MTRPRDPNSGNKIVKLHCDGPERHLQHIDVYRASAMDGAPCSAVRGCPGRVRVARAIVEADPQRSIRVPWLVAGLMSASILVLLGVGSGVVLSFQERWGTNADATEPTVVSTVEVDVARQAPSASEETPSAAAKTEIDATGVHGKEVAPPEIEDSTSSPQAISNEGSSTIHTAPAEPYAGISIDSVFSAAMSHRADPRVIGVLAALVVALLFWQIQVVVFGALGAICGAFLGACFSEPAALWGCVVGFLSGIADGIRMILPRKRRRL